MSGNAMATSSDRISLWAEALWDGLFPEQEVASTPVLLACDDEAVRVAADRLGLGSGDPSTQLGRDVAVAFGVGKIAGWKTVMPGDWANMTRPRPLAPFFPVLCLWVLAASRMAPYENHTTGEYHGQLCKLVGVSGDDSLPCFNFIGSRFREFADWLAEDMKGRRGRLIVPEAPRPEHVGFAVAQTVFRMRDRQVLSTFFAERLRGSLDGFDPLRRLQRWSGRGALTKHALGLVENPEMAERVRAGIQSAFNSWDGAELVEVGGGRVGRIWPAKIRLLPYPPKLQFGADQPKELELALERRVDTLAPGRELVLSWELLDRAVAATVTLGDPATGAIRLPRLGETIMFETGEEGMFRVDSPAAETVWVLSRDPARHRSLERLRFNDGGALPDPWQLFYDVPVTELPGVERATVEAPTQTPLRIEGGLPLGRRLYLSGIPPYLAAGDLEVEGDLRVSVNGEHHRFISSGDRIALPAEPGWCSLEVGDGDYHAEYEVLRAGEPAPARLCHHLSDGHALRRGARPCRDDAEGTTVCGATITPAGDGKLPYLTRVLCDVETIDTAGELAAHPRPAAPAWFREVGLSERGRWEVISDREIVWLLMPPAGGRSRVRLLADLPLTAIEGAAAERVLAVGEDVDISRGVLDHEETRARWQETVALARLVAEVTV